MIIINFIILSILIIKSTNSSPIHDQKTRSNNDKWLTRTKLSNDESWKKYLVSKSSKLITSTDLFSNTKTSDSDTVKSLDSNYRKAINKLLTDLNREKSISISSPKSVQSLYPLCDDIDLESDDEDIKLIKENKLLPLYYDLEKTIINKPTNNIIKSQLRIYLKKKSIDNCDCKSNLNMNEDNLLHLSLYDASTSNKITFLSFKEEEVNKKNQHIQTVKLNRCCDHLITFDLTELVKKWQLYPQLNNGLLLELKDNLGNKLNIDDFIHTMNCSDKNPPLPFFKMIYPQFNNGLLLELKYPTLDIAFNRNDGGLFSNNKNSNSEQQIFDDDRIDKDANV